MPAAADDILLQLAMEVGLVSPSEADAALASAPANACNELILRGVLDASRLNEVLAARFGMTPVDVARVKVPADVLELISRNQALHYELLPLGRSGENLEVAVADPLATDGMDAMAHLLGVTIVPRLAPRAAILTAINRLYGSGTDGLAAVLDGEPGSSPQAPGSIRSNEESGDGDAPIIRLVHGIIAKAVAQRASDIHLEPLERRLRVRYRIDGVLITAESPPKRLQAAVISRVKIMAGISIAEKRLPQDGRIQVTVDGRTLDLRVFSLPTSHGEGVVMRLLDQESLRIGLGELGFMADDRAMFERLIGRPDGIVLVTGPTDSVAGPLRATKIFPDMVPSMIEVGEETGALPDMLVRVADGYDEEVDNAVNALTSLIEPLMIVVMAVMVGTIVIALFLPIVRIIQSLG
ncbi:MAG: hypothetical protein RIS54_1610 [Verrucomicrobiota bacterium]|jgi:general secretion pathway protein E/type IV pilus assembly protein PilB